MERQESKGPQDYNDNRNRKKHVTTSRCGDRNRRIGDAFQISFACLIEAVALCPCGHCAQSKRADAGPVEPSGSVRDFAIARCGDLNTNKIIEQGAIVDHCLT